MKNKADYYKKQGLTSKGKETAMIKMAKDTNRKPRVPEQFQRNKFYSTANWQKTRESYIHAHPLCERCKLEGLLVPARLVHHVRPLRYGGEQLDQNNLRSICGEVCHAAEHTEIERMRAAGEVDW